MTSKADVVAGLRIVSQAWGPQDGYVFFPYIDREEQVRAGTRRAGFHEGPAFKWPADKERIIDHLLAHVKDDVYWSTAIFEKPIRREDYAADEYALWADLDEADPSAIDDEYTPTVAWESSPGRYQALWLPKRGKAAAPFNGASWPGNENQKLTYHIGADPSGWDTVQLLRIPGWNNHKPSYKKPDGSYPKGKTLWTDGPRYGIGDFKGLPELNVGNTQLTDALASDIDAVDRLKVIANVRLKLNHRARETLGAREAVGDKSDNLWYLTRCLADAGLSVAEIVAVVRETPWNKFRDRQDELRRLISEASKAIAKKSEETNAKLDAEEGEEEANRPDPQRLGFLLKNIKRPKYVVQSILSEGACGFIAGEPKSFKSWVGLDLAFSVATGADFLGEFPVLQKGPVLYIQEEDPPTTLKNRSAKIWVNKAIDHFELLPHQEGVSWLPPEQDAAFDPDVNAYIQQGFQISDPAWQLWLDETLATGLDGVPYKLIIIDTLMMTAGEVDENRSQEMTTKIFRPLKLLSRKHNVAVQVIHHMAKSEKARPGQRLLGSVANHAWAEDSMYLSRSASGGNIRIDTESKTIPGGAYRMSNLNNQAWDPRVEAWSGDEEKTEDTGEYRQTQQRRTREKKQAEGGKGELLQMIANSPQGYMTTQAIAAALSIQRSTAHKRLSRLLEKGDIQIEQLDDGKINHWYITK